MQNYINKFEHFITDIDFNQLVEISPMRKAKINFIFLYFLERQKSNKGMIWLTYYTFFDDRAYTMETSQLEAEVKVFASMTLNMITIYNQLYLLKYLQLSVILLF